MSVKESGSPVQQIQPGMVVRLVRQAVTHGFTGCIQLRGEGRSASIYLGDGRVTHVKTNVQAFRLGDILIDRYGFDERSVKVAAELGKVNKMLMGMVLLRRKLITPTDLFRSLVDQVGLVLQDAVNWASGTCQLQPGAVPDKDVVLLRVDPLAILGPEVPPPEELRAIEAARELVAEKNLVPDDDHYAILGVDPAATDAEIKEAYNRLVLAWHPDRIGGHLGDEDLAALQGIFARINAAWSVVGKADARAKYDRELKRAAAAATEPPPDQEKEDANAYFRSGAELLKAERFLEAADYLENASRLDPASSRNWFFLGAAYFKARESKKAEDALLRAIHLDGSKAEYYVALSQVYRAGKLYTRAMEMVDRALRWDPENDQARYERKLLKELTQTKKKK
jgi:hypothetical protein